MLFPNYFLLSFSLPSLLFIKYSSNDLQLTQVAWRTRLMFLAGPKKDNLIQINRSNGQNQRKSCDQNFKPQRLPKQGHSILDNTVKRGQVCSHWRWWHFLWVTKRCGRPKFPFMSPSMNGEQLHYLSHAVLLVKSAHYVLLNAAGCRFFFFPKTWLLCSFLVYTVGDMAFWLESTKIWILSRVLKSGPELFRQKWPNQSSYYTILWPVTNTWIDIYLQEMLAGAGGSHWLVLFTAPHGALAAATMERPLHRCTVYSPKWAVNQSGGRKGRNNAGL